MPLADKAEIYHPDLPDQPHVRVPARAVAVYERSGWQVVAEPVEAEAETATTDEPTDAPAAAEVAPETATTAPEPTAPAAVTPPVTKPTSTPSGRPGGTAASRPADGTIGSTGATDTTKEG
jgi:hypothetical protein